jgi:hypothetical protein
VLRACLAVVASACLLLGGACPAFGATALFNPYALTVDHASGRVYWANFGGGNGGAISYANLDGSGSGTLNTSGATIVAPLGIAVDPAAGLVYWVNQTNPHPIGFARLDGSGGGDLATGAATSVDAHGLVLVDGTLYWPNADNGIAFAPVGGQGGGELHITGSASVMHPAGPSIDPATERIYWANTFGTTIASATLTGADSRNLVTTGATVVEPTGTAIDPARNRIYWVNNSLAITGVAGHNISYADLAGGGGGDLALPDDASAQSIAIDPVAGRIVWATSSPALVRSANLDGSDVKVLAPVVDTSLHAPVIDDAPPSSTPLTDASLLYHAVDQGVTLSCQLDGGAESACTGRSAYAHLAVGRHCFSVNERRNALDGPAVQACWTVTQLAPGCSASFHHGYFVTAGAATLARRAVVFHATTDGVAGRIALQTTSKGKIRVSYQLDGQVVSGGPRATLAYAQLDRTRSHTLTVTVTSGGERARIVRRFRYASFVAIACGGRRVVGRIAARTVRVGGAAVTVSAQVPKEIRATTKLRFLVTDRSHVLRAAHFTFAGKALTQHALNAALTAQQLRANGSQTMTVALVPRRGGAVTVRIVFRTAST